MRSRSDLEVGARLALRRSHAKLATGSTDGETRIVGKFNGTEMIRMQVPHSFAASKIRVLSSKTRHVKIQS